MMFFAKKDKFETKETEYLERKSEQKEINDPLKIILEFLKEKKFLEQFTDFNDISKVKWNFGSLGKKMMNDLVLSWNNKTAKKMSNIRPVEQITPRIGTEYLIEIFAEDHLKAPFGFTRVYETAIEPFDSDKFTFHGQKSKNIVLEYATIPSTSKDMLVSWLEFVTDFFESSGLSSDDTQVEYQRLEDNPDQEHYFFDRFLIKNIFHFGTETVATVSNKLDFEFENYDKRFPDDKKQSCFVHDDLRQNDYFPHVIEISINIERFILAVLLNNFSQERIRTSLLTKLKLPPSLAPVKCVIFPLSIVDKRTKIASDRIYETLKERFFVSYDEKGTLEKRITKYNELGVPFYIETDPDLVDNNLFRLHDNKFKTSSELDIKDIVSYISSKINE
ncbi:MAG: His/Gly/Thr/Pro-type tRNA ligase C-terminal domain-containing protein [Candidatus Delongbacteria bacterium]